MRQRAILIASVAINLALVAALFAFYRKYPRGPLQVGDTPGVATAANSDKTRIVVRKQFFSWQDVESDNYPIYIKNLRDIGVPEQTIRDIIVADVNQLYARKRQTEVVTADQQWWRSDPDTSLDQAAMLKVAALEQERRALLTTLLGPDWETATGPQPPRPGIVLNGPVLGELSPDVKQAVQDISTRSQQRTMAYIVAQRQAGKNPDPGEIARIRQETRNQLAQILTPAQLEEFLLRYSQSAAGLRRDLHGFDVSADEFRRIFRATDAIDQQIANDYSGDSVTTAQQRAALERQRDDAIKNTLGPERYEELIMAKDPAYRDAVMTAQETGASPAMVTNLYAINVAAMQEMDRISNDATLSADQKAMALKAVQDQQQSASDQLLGVTPPPSTTTTAATQPVPTIPHPYVPGETIDGIANTYGVSADDLRKANPGLDFNRLTRDAVIRVPQPGATGR